MSSSLLSFMLMIKHIRKLPQVSMNTEGGSALQKYRKRVSGPTGWGTFIGYELAITLFSSIGGALGLALRKIFFPSLFKRCEKGVVFGRYLTIRQPKKTVIGAGTLLLADAEAKGVYIGAGTERSRVPSTRLRNI